MSNRTLIENAINQLNTRYNTNYRIGIYHDLINNLSKRTVNRIIEHLGEYADIHCTLKGEKYVVELAEVDGEIDIMIRSQNDYKNLYFT